MTSLTDFISSTRELLAAGKISQAIADLRNWTNNSDDTENSDAIVQLSQRYSSNEKSNNFGQIERGVYSRERNQITAALLHMLSELKPMESDGVDRTRINNSNITAPNISMTHSGSGDNVAGNKIIKSSDQQDKRLSDLIKNEYPVSPNILEKTPEPTSGWGFLGRLFDSIPSPFNAILAVFLISGAGYVGYNAYMPKKDDAAISSQPVLKTEKVYVSGRLYIDNVAPKPGDVKRLVLKNMPDVNSVKLDNQGKYTFENVKIPGNKKLLVDVTFGDDADVPTEELSVGKVNAEDNTVYLPDLYAERPKPAKLGKPASNWSVKIINQVNTGGDNNASQK